MATLVDALTVDSSLGYTFSQSSRLVNVLQYADDTCLIADGPASCQRMLERVAFGWNGQDESEIAKVSQPGHQGFLRQEV